MRLSGPCRNRNLMAVTRRALAFVRGYPIVLTTVLSVLILALVFTAALQAVPSGLLPRAPDVIIAAIPHLNTAVSLVAIGTIVRGVISARRERYDHHRRAMMTSLGLFIIFLTLYLYRVALEGPTAFPGPAGVYTTIYLPLLAIHVTLAIVCVPLLIYVATLGLSHSIKGLKDTRHRTVGRVAAALWVVSFMLGIVVYLLLYVIY